MRTEDPNSYWKFWKSLNPRNVTTGPTLGDFVNYFEQQVYPPHVDYFDYEHINNIIKQVKSFQHNVEHDKSNMTQFLNSPITAEEIKKTIQNLKCKKAAGVDGISAEFYKYGCNELLPAIELLFNTILTNGEYPSRWATGIIHPVHMAFQIVTEKSQSCRVLGNYLNLYLITDSHLKTKYVMIMIPIKLVLKPIRELRTIYSYYVPS